MFCTKSVPVIFYFLLWASTANHMFFQFHFPSESINKLHSDDNRFNFFFPSSLLEQDGDLYPLTPPLESYDPDPMMNGSVEDPEPPQDLLMYLNNPNLFDNDLLQDDQSLPDFSLQGFNCLLPQSCGSFP